MKKELRFFISAFMLLAISSILNVSAQTVTDTYSTPGTFVWNCPAGVTTVDVECWGGGGAGSTATSNLRSASGGGGGYSRRVSYAVVPGNNYTVVVGAGGITNIGPVNGGASSFDGGGIVANGGTGRANNITTPGGAGATLGVGDVGFVFIGGNGRASVSGGTGGGGGGGSSAGTASNGTNATTVNGAVAPAGGGNGGNGGAGTSGANLPGSPGVFPGGGGGGVREELGGTTLGGNGANGQVKITYTATFNPPVYTSCPSNISTGTTGICGAVVNYNPTLSGTNPITQSFVFTGATTGSGSGTGSGSTFNLGTTTVTLTATNGILPDATCVFTITVSDNQIPSISCSPVSQNADPGVCNANVTITTPTNSDNCGVASIVNNFNGTSNASGNYPVGSTNVVWTVTDVNGNTNTCTQVVTVTDNQNPTISCGANQSASAPLGFCTAAVVVPGPTTSDNCAVNTVTNSFNGTSNASGNYPVGVTNIVWTVSDAAGNTATCLQTVTVNEITPPTITCGPNALQVADPGACNAFTVVVGPTANDNCGIMSVINNFNGTSTASDIYPVGITTVIWTVTDNSGNTATCSQTVTVNDTQAPTVTCVNFSANADPGQCSATVVIPVPSRSDNCGVASLVNDYNSTGNASGNYPVGITTVVWTVTDVHGNPSTCSMTVTITDNQNPTITCPPTVNTGVDPGLCTASGVALGSPTTGDNCGVASVTNNAPSIYPTGPTTVTWTVTDIHGRTATCTQTVNVQENIPPSLACPSNITANNTPGGCDATVNIPNIVFSDNCGTPVLNWTITTPLSSYGGTGQPGTQVIPVGLTTVSLVVTDAATNTTTCSFTITVTDTQNPIITCPGNVTTIADPGSCDASVSIALPSVSDNCTIATVVNDYNSTNDASDVYPVGTTPVLWTITDVNGLTATCTQLVTVNDTQNPTITCPATVSVNADPGQCNAVITSIGTPATNDNCGVASVSNNHPSTTYPLGTTIVTWTVTDVNGLTASCTQNVTVTDNQNPTITCPVTVSVPADAGQCSAVISSIGTPSTADNCGVASVSNNHASTIYPVGTTSVIWTVTDVNGLTATCTQLVTVLDTQAPSITCGTSTTANADPGACDAFVSVSGPSTADNCGVSTIVNDWNSTSDASDTYPVGTTIVTWTVTDANGNTNSCTQTVTVADTQDPTITCSSTVSVNADPGQCNAVVSSLGTPATNDNCGVSSVSNNHPSTTYPVGTTVVTWTVTDVNGRTATCTQNVTVTDNQNPTITCPATVSVLADAGQCSAVIASIGSPAVSDNCGIASTLNNHPSTTYPVGTTIVIWTVTDVNGLTASCSQSVTVLDTQAPSITCGSSATANADPGACDANVTVSGPSATDNCAVASVVNDYNSTSDASDNYPVGTTVVTWTVTDLSGNTNTCTQNVTVTDTQNPTITCPANVSVNADAGQCNAVITSIGTPTTGDNCGVATVINNHPSTTYPVGTTSVVWTVTDINGLTATCTQVVTVTDNQNPTISCPATVSVGADAGQCSAVISSIGTPIVSDNCAVSSTTNDHPSTTYTVGTTTVVWTVTDVNGHTATCTQLVTVIDTEVPSITCGGTATANASPASCDAFVSVSAPSTGDNCAVSTIVNDWNSTSDASDTYPVGTTVVTWTVTDLSGNTNTCTQNVTVTDTQNPTITCPATVSVNADAGQCSATISSLGSPITNDNCAVASVSNDHPSNIYPVGNTVVTWTVTDVNGLTAICTQNVSVTDTEAPVITCPSNIVVSNAIDTCGAVVIFSMPIVTDNCTSSSSQTFNFTGGMQTFVVPAGVTSLSIDALGARGGNGGSIGGAGGFGGRVQTNLAVTPGQVLNIFVGEAGPDFTSGVNAFNGGGAGGFGVVASGGGGGATDIRIGGTSLADRVIVAGSGGGAGGWWGVSGGAGGDLVGANGATGQSGGGFGGDQSSGGAGGFGSGGGPAGSPGTLGTGGNGGNGAAGGGGGGGGGYYGGGGAGGDDDGCCTDGGGGAGGSSYAGPGTSGTIHTQGFNGGNGMVTLTWTSSGSLTQTSGLPSGSIFPVGTTTNTFTATDGSGNASTCSFTVTVNDTQAPVITCGSDVTVDADPGVCDHTNTGGISDATATDNCGVSTIVNDWNSTSTLAGETFPVGTTTVLWTATDVNGITSTCTQMITVQDNQDPVFTCPSNVTQSNDPGSCDAFVTIPVPVASDNCAITSIVNDWNSTNDASDFYPEGINFVTWTVTDINGNISTCIQTVTITDDEDPTITCPANVTVNNNPGVCFATGVALGTPTVGDNCGVAGFSNNSTGTYNLGANTVIWTVTDIHGRTSTCSQTVTVVDNEFPTISCAPNQTQTAGAGACSAFVTVTGPAAGDNCSFTVTNDHTGTSNASGTYPVGTTSVVWTVTDGAGHTTTCTQLITITDNQAPVITCAPNVVINTSCPPTTAILTPPSVSDNCGVGSLTNNAPPFYPAGVTVVTWTATDIHGNTATCTQTVTVTSPEADITGNGWAIINNANTVSLINGTDFGNVSVCGGTVTRNYVVKNSGNGNLTVSSLALTGLNANQFAITGAPVLPVTISPGGTITISVTFDPTSSDYKNARLTVYNTDCNEGVYWFAIRGRGIACPILIPEENPLANIENVEMINDDGSMQTGIDETNLWDGKLYPNPSDGIFTLELTELPIGDVQMRMVDALGQVVSATPIVNQTMYYDFSYLRAGTYYVQVITKDKVITKQIIITQKY